MGAMKHFRRKTAFFLLALLMLGTIGFFYINKILLPVKIKQFVTQHIQDILQHDVEINSLQFTLTDGFVFQNINIYKKNEPHKILLHIDNVSFNILITPLLKNKKIIIPSLQISKPFLLVAHKSNNQWNLSNLLKKKLSPSNTKYQFLIGKININDGSIDYIDKTQKPLFHESIKNINLSISLSSLEKGVKFSGNSKLPIRQATISAEGDYNIFSKTLSAHLMTSNFPLEKYLPLLNLQSNLSLKTGILSSPGVNIIYKNKTLSASGKLNLSTGSIYLDSKKIFTGNIHASLTDFTYSSDQWSLTGNITLPRTNIQITQEASIQGNLNLPKINIHHKDGLLTVKGSASLSQGNIKLTEQRFFKGHLSATEYKLTLYKNNFNLNTQLVMNNATLQWTENVSFKGSPSFQLNLSHDLENKFLYNGSASFKKASLSAFPYINTLTNIQGSIAFQNDILSTKILTLTMHETPWQISAQLQNFTDPTISLDVSTNQLPLDKAVAFYNIIKKKTLPINLEGTASLKASYEGSLTKFDDEALNIKTTLKNTLLSSDTLSQNISEINGNIKYTKGLIRWNALQGKYNKQTYTLNGKLKSFFRPVVTTQITSSQINIDTKINILRKAFRIVSLEGVVFNAPINITGDVHLFENAAPDLDFKGTFSIDMKNIPALVPKIQPLFDQYKPIGTLSGEGLFRGKHNDRRNWVIALNINSPLVTIKDIPLKNVAFKIEQRDNHIGKCNLSAKVYDGDFSITSSADLLANDIPANLIFQLTDMDLSLWKENKKIKNKNLAGKLSIHSTLKGPIKNLDKIKGEGSFTIKDGYLGHLSKIYPDAYFTSAKADFVIKNKKAITENAKLFSQAVILNGQGWIDLDQNIYFDIVPGIGNITISGKKNISLDPSFLLQEAISLSCSGTIKKPNCQPNASPTKIIGNTTGFILKGVGSILEGLF
ncbi:hypothetical protein MNBD_UNCLBAC01-71 [hydrothermal vent metagenome]|uniref:Uncharacterized protein n=1 Tax=hydrothermal vent metagenome TaxID=652676 RepID=A0A3B1D2Y8_9ZZZZ